MADFEEVHRTQHEYEAQDMAAMLRAKGVLASVSIETSCVTEYVVAVPRDELSRADTILREDDR
jgi:hypothetical protein